MNIIGFVAGNKIMNLSLLMSLLICVDSQNLGLYMHAGIVFSTCHAYPYIYTHVKLC